MDESVSDLATGRSVEAMNSGLQPEDCMAIVDGRRQVTVYGPARLIEDIDEVVEIAPLIRENAPVLQSAEETRAWAGGQRVIIVVRATSYYPSTMPPSSETQALAARL